MFHVLHILQAIGTRQSLIGIENTIVFALKFRGSVGIVLGFDALLGNEQVVWQGPRAQVSRVCMLQTTRRVMGPVDHLLCDQSYDERDSGVLCSDDVAMLRDVLA
jgi:hypothetical protein